MRTDKTKTWSVSKNHELVLAGLLLEILPAEHDRGWRLRCVVVKTLSQLRPTQAPRQVIVRRGSLKNVSVGSWKAKIVSLLFKKC